MALVVSQNSWVTIAEADAYLTDRIDASSWFDLGDTGDPGATSKTTLLASSFQWLIGDPSLELSSTLTDDNVKNAQTEGALFLLKYSLELQAKRAFLSFGGKSFRLSRRAEGFTLQGLAIPVHIVGLLREYQRTNMTVELKGHYDEE